MPARRARGGADVRGRGRVPPEAHLGGRVDGRPGDARGRGPRPARARDDLVRRRRRRPRLRLDQPRRRVVAHARPALQRLRRRGPLLARTGGRAVRRVLQARRSVRPRPLVHAARRRHRALPGHVAPARSRHLREEDAPDQPGGHRLRPRPAPGRAPRPARAGAEGPGNDGHGAGAGGRLRIREPDHEHGPAALAQGRRAAFGLDPRHVQAFAADDGRGALRARTRSRAWARS